MTIRALKVSMATYGEIAGLLEQAGVKINAGETLQIDKSDRLVPPVDFRLVTIRRDVAGICGPIFHGDDKEEFVDFVNAVYNFVINGKEEIAAIKPTEN